MPNVNTVDTKVMVGGDGETIDINPAAGSQLGALICVAWNDTVLSLNPATLTSVVIDSVGACTFLQLGGAVPGTVEHWFVVGIPLGLQGITLMWSSDAGPVDVLAHIAVIVFDHMAQATPFGTMKTNSGNSTTPSTSLTAVAASSLAVDTTINDETVITTCVVGALQTQRWNTRYGAVATTGRRRSAGSTEPGGGNIDMTWTLGAARQWGIAAVEVRDYITWTITASAGLHGAISPSGAVVVEDGTDQGFLITADPGYQIADVLVDGVSVGAVASYLFTTVSASHTIAASFVLASGIRGPLRSPSIVKG